MICSCVAVATSSIVLIMVVSSITLLPAFLGLAGHKVNGLLSGRRQKGHTVGDGWARWGEHVSKHAWAYLIGVTALLVGLTLPVFALRLGFPDEGTLPDSRTERRAYDLVAEGFGPGLNGPLLIAVDISQDASVVNPLADAIVADEGIVAIAPPEVNTEAGVATIIAIAGADRGTSFVSRGTQDHLCVCVRRDHRVSGYRKRDRSAAVLSGRLGGVVRGRWIE